MDLSQVQLILVCIAFFCAFRGCVHDCGAINHRAKKRRQPVLPQYMENYSKYNHQTAYNQKEIPGHIQNEQAGEQVNVQACEQVNEPPSYRETIG